MRLVCLRHAPLWAFLVVTAPAHAAGSLLVDDAGTLANGQCQLEGWLRGRAGPRELTAVAACARGGSEGSLGLGHLRGDGSAPWTLGVKRTLGSLRGERVQLAIAATAGGDLRRAGARAWSLNVPLSIALDADGRAQLHLNAGQDRSRTARGLTGGIGTAFQLGPRWSLLAERWRDAGGERSTQFGLRRHLHGEATLDLLGGRSGGVAAPSWFSVGLNLPLAR